ADPAEALRQFPALPVKIRSAGLARDPFHYARTVFVASRQPAVHRLGIADREQEHIVRLRSLDRVQHVMRARIVLAIAEENQRAPAALDILHHKSRPVEDGVIKSRPEHPDFAGADDRIISAPLATLETLERTNQLPRRAGIVADQKQAVRK